MTGAAVVAGLGILALARNRHPWNLVSVACWSVVLAVAIVAVSEGGGYISLQLLVMCMIGTAATIPVCTLKLTERTRAEPAQPDERGVLQPATPARTETYLISLETASLVSWATMAVVSVAVYYAGAKEATDGKYFASAGLGATALHFWLMFDSARLCTKFSPDEYIKGVVFFYADILSVFAICLLCAWCASACEGNETAASMDIGYGATAICCLDGDHAAPPLERRRRSRRRWRRHRPPNIAKYAGSRDARPARVSMWRAPCADGARRRDGATDVPPRGERLPLVHVQ